MNANHLKKNMAVKIDSDLCIVTRVEHHKPGKGAAVVRVRLKSLSKQTTVEYTFRSGENVEEVTLEKSHATLSYQDGDSIVFMDTTTYEQYSILKSDIEDFVNFLNEGAEVTILLYNEQPVSVIPPNFVELEVSYAEDAVKGDSATNPTKEVELITNAKIHVPMFVKKGDIVKIDLRDMKYVERV